MYPQKDIGTKELMIDGNKLYFGEDYVGEWDENHFIPSQSLLESSTSFQDLVGYTTKTQEVLDRLTDPKTRRFY